VLILCLDGGLVFVFFILIFFPALGGFLCSAYALRPEEVQRKRKPYMEALAAQFAPDRILE